MNQRFVLFVDDGPWRLASVAGEHIQLDDLAVHDDGTLTTRAAAVRQRLDELDETGEPLLVALPSHWVLSARISTGELPRKGKRRAMGFRLEEHLPLSVEEMIADFIEHPGFALGACSEEKRLSEIVEALEASDIVVERLCPTALLAASHVVNCSASVELVLLGSPRVSSQDPADDDETPSCLTFDLVALTDGRASSWVWLGDDLETVQQMLESRADETDEPIRIALVGPLADLPWLKSRLERYEIVPAGADSTDVAAASEAMRVLTGTTEPSVDLRRDSLAVRARSGGQRRSVATLVVSTIILLLAVCVISQWRGRQYQTLAREFEQSQAEVFRAAAPDQRLPAAGISSRLLSERRRLEGLGGHAADEASMAALAAPSALAHLLDVLSSLPTDIRHRILQLDIEPQRIRLVGEARSYAEAQRVATALEATGLFDVQPPDMQALADQGVSFAFTAAPTARAVSTAEAR